MKRNAFSILFFVNKKKLLKNGDAPIYIRLSVGGQRCDSAIKRGVKPSLWDQSQEITKGRDRSSHELNDYIRALKLRALTLHREMELAGRLFTSRLLMDMLFNVEEDRNTLFKLYHKHNDDCRKLIGIDYVAATVSRYDNCCRQLETLVERKLGKSDIAFCEVTPELIRDFEIYLKVERRCQQNTMVRYMKCLKKILSLARANDWMHHDPFAGMKFQTKEVVREALSKNEIKRLMTKEFECDRLNYVRDVFIFCVFTGLAYIDAYNLTADHITTDNNGDEWIRKARQKTDNMCNIPLLDIPKMIIEKYRDNPLCIRSGRLLPIQSNQKMNSYLKEIAVKCDIKKPLTTHIARYTYASVVCLANGVTMENVAKMLGHSDTRMTQHYAKVMDSSIKRDMDNVAKVFNF